MFLKNKIITFKIRRSKITDYAALSERRAIPTKVNLRAKCVRNVICGWSKKMSMTRK